LSEWAIKRRLSFSATKTQEMSVKGNPQENTSIPFGDSRIYMSNKVRYLGLIWDKKRTYWEHTKIIADKSEDLYSRLRGTRSANWGIMQKASGIIYGAVFLPRILYASEIWYEAVKLIKSIKLLGSRQRKALLSITGAYKTTSSDALQVVAGRLPLDLEIQWRVFTKKAKEEKHTEERINEWKESILSIWQERWDSSSKGRWTYSFMPDVRERTMLPLELDYYIVQFLTGHGDFNSKLESMGLVGEGICRCEENEETVSHVLFECNKWSAEREIMKTSIGAGVWPCECRKFMESRANFEALRRFACKVLKDKMEMRLKDIKEKRTRYLETSV